MNQVEDDYQEHDTSNEEECVNSGNQNDFRMYVLPGDRTVNINDEINGYRSNENHDSSMNQGSSSGNFRLTNRPSAVSPNTSSPAR